MLEKNQKREKNETQNAFAVALLLLNVLLLAITCGMFWALHMLFTQYSPFNTFMRGGFLQ